MKVLLRDPYSLRAKKDGYADFSKTGDEVETRAHGKETVERYSVDRRIECRLRQFIRLRQRLEGDGWTDHSRPSSLDDRLQIFRRRDLLSILFHPIGPRRRHV